MWGSGAVFSACTATSALHIGHDTHAQRASRKNPSNLRFEGVFSFGSMFIRLS